MGCARRSAILKRVNYNQEQKRKKRGHEPDCLNGEVCVCFRREATHCVAEGGGATDRTPIYIGTAAEDVGFFHVCCNRVQITQSSSA